MKQTLRDEYFTRLKKIMKTSLNSKNSIDAINTFATSAITYGFAVLDWSITDLESIDRETRNILKKYHLLLVSASQAPLRSKSLHEKANKYSEEIDEDTDELATKTKLQMKNQLKKKRIGKKKQQLSNKAIHGQYLRLLDEAHIDKDLSTAWLRDSRLKRPTEAAICAIQEQAVTTNYVRKHVHKTTNNDTCRVCKSSKETIHHVISGCSVLAPTKYVQRHDNLCKYVHKLLVQN